MLTLQDAIYLFRDGKLHIDCKDMVLTQTKRDGANFTGKGYIYQDTDEAIWFKMYVLKYENTDPFTFFSRQQSLFELVATTYDDDRQWIATEIVPYVHWNASNIGEVFINGRAVCAKLC